MYVTLLRNGFEHPADVGLGMDAQQLFVQGRDGLAPNQSLESWIPERLLDGFQTANALRMSRSRVVSKEARVAVIPGRHTVSV
jgi:hypothetical protein